MLQALKDKWVEALRSGEYTQGNGYLCRTNGDEKFCCLGVLCDVAEIPWEDGKALNGSLNIRAYGKSPKSPMDNGITMPPDHLYEKLGLSIKLATDLVGLNDSGQDFEFIANYINTELVAE